MTDSQTDQQRKEDSMNELQQLLSAQYHYEDLRREAEEAYLINQTSIKRSGLKNFVDQFQSYMKSFYSFYTNVAGLGTKLN